MMTSSKSTKSAIVKDGVSIPPSRVPDKRDEQIAALQTDLASSKDARLEERYWLGFLAAFFFDGFLFSHLGFGQCLLLFLIQLVPMIYFAKKLGIDEAAILLDGIYGIISDKFKLNKGE